MLATLRHPATTPVSPALPPLVIAHGLYGSARNWNVIARRLADQRDVVAVDMRNHGESPRADSQSYADMAADLAEVIQRLGQPVDLLGHSMGGKAAMQLALTQGDLLRRLVVADIAPVAYSHDQSHYAKAMQALDLHDLGSRGEADRRLTALIDDPALRAFFLQSLDLKAESGPRWRLNLPVLEAEMAKIVGWPGTRGHFSGPALFLTGALSPYVRPEHRDEIQARFPAARFARLAGAGHWLHADKPREFEETIRVFLNS
ncbi:alpha/beta fold hydrolase [Pseudogemmobacter faecipullorum]|uniref:Alpha/beta fold hydrolase n=1 Tax=Pseudogemmobacter faecipullorum TaxID=2755041 RepID=A0ABS8CPT0_9RHOB|nr:alpha/beta fold hydrolase [Pseudogemmobacter faecipullorum]MCB5411374.1 alpha/beta fold hydrolase [Pseudogemmobacter faecipullorum]